MFYCVLKNSEVCWHSGVIDFALSDIDIKLMYQEENNEQFNNIECEIKQIDDRQIISNIMNKKASYMSGEWIFTDIELTPDTKQYNVEEELFNTQTKLLEQEMLNQQIGQELFNLQTSLINGGVI